MNILTEIAAEGIAEGIVAEADEKGDDAKYQIFTGRAAVRRRISGHGEFQPKRSRVQRTRRRQRTGGVK